MIFARMVILISIIFTLQSCATGENFSSIREGMSKKEVQDILGNHDQVKKDESGFSTYFYRNRLMSGWSWDKTDYYIVFNPNGEVYEYGHGEIDTRTSERMVQWGRDQQLINAIKAPINTECNSIKYGITINTKCQTK